MHQHCQYSCYGQETLQEEMHALVSFKHLLSYREGILGVENVCLRADKILLKSLPKYVSPYLGSHYHGLAA